MNDVEYVGFVPRAGAWCVDKLLVLMLTSLMAWAWPVPGLTWQGLVACGSDLARWQAELPLIAMALARWLLPAALTVFFLTRIRATPGKYLLRAIVVDAETGATLGQRQAWLRTLACGLSYLTLGLGHAWVIVDRRKQSLHDKIAHTVVIRRPK
ncbi:RDD family protein [Paludibacterium purpuratum]|uniref:Putative RDD family membrane protein YckC n=1 Tax=Paludibacterium purpuratum TaxID=1144873 RepID=A0A4R7B1Q5_9NEIS|nr:RDD family protein [Paludibacterium purpuratum]TDR76651.1 putative RDD family membrane protein YckC [Paludibacterium purpuratum]